MEQQILEVTGIPSAHDKNRMFYPQFNGKHWECQCEHFKIYHTPCRHILEKQFNNVQELYDHICKEVENNRDIRDIECQDFDDVITYVSMYRDFEVNKLATLLLNLAVYRGKVSTDDLHVATKEQYADDRIVGTVCGVLLRSGLIEVVGRKPTDRKCAHGRGINIYAVTKKGFKMLEARRPERSLYE